MKSKLKSIQNRNPNERAMMEATAVGTKAVASEVGAGAGAICALTFVTADTAINITTTAAKSFIFIDSIASKLKSDLKESKRMFEVMEKVGNLSD
ncbi:unnamed protein product [Lactuca virosa]|uniref:VAN3-binding protein-like auxin canalisation domain-containing protein n=1 Tax=Lactuca virosa TaxID=75947 RepID=A0AAU9NG37_9ASTR|nr:unnamed protein product [Lactuca virosa]